MEAAAAARAGDLTVHQTDLAAGGPESEGFALGAALDHVAEHWVDQVQTLLDACAHISNHMRCTKNQHAADESYIAGTLSVRPSPTGRR